MPKSINSIIFFIATLIILSCQNRKNELSENKKVDKQLKLKIEEIKSTKFLQTENRKDDTIQIAKKDILDITFIGKTRQELYKYNIYTCFGILIEGKSENYAVSEYSLNIENCRNGKSKLCLEKFKNYYGQGNANFEIKDELIVTSNCPKRCYSTIVHKLGNSKFIKNYLIEYEDNYKEILTKIYRLWEIDLSKEKFIEVEIPKNFKCNNPEYAEGI